MIIMRFIHVWANWFELLWFCQKLFSHSQYSICYMDILHSILSKPGVTYVNACYNLTITLIITSTIIPLSITEQCSCCYLYIPFILDIQFTQLWPWLNTTATTVISVCARSTYNVFYKLHPKIDIMFCFKFCDKWTPANYTCHCFSCSYIRHKLLFASISSVWWGKEIIYYKSTGC